ncbi:MAG: SDR family oxidoreductase [Gemmobacter sp.]|nr:SDR family oxidoreductase [Gemmobacter sp.]
MQDDMESETRQPGIEAEMDPAPDYMPRYPGSGRLEGKIALITGGDSGIGRATAVLFAREGARVAIHYKDEHRDAQETLALIEAEGGEGLLLHGDIGQRAEAMRVVREVENQLGTINILVNNAAEQHAQKEVTDISEDQLRRTFDTNLFSQFFLVQQVLPGMTRGDTIINISSVTAFRGQDLLIDYASTKGGILALTRALAKKLAPEGIRVNAVAPGPIWTPLIPASFPPEKVRSFGKDAPLGRPGQPCEVAPAILFLACEDSSYMTGQTLHPNGGEAVGG